MVYLLLSILSSTGIFVTFKIAGKKNISGFNIIIINYLAAALLGLSSSKIPDGYNLFNQPWLLLSVLIGVLFIVMFFVIAKSTEYAGIGTTTIASKMSVITPILFSIYYFKEDISFLKILGILLAVFAVVLTVYIKSDKSTPRVGVFLPVLLFIGMGIVDSIVKYAQEIYVEDNIAGLFTSILFSISFFTGLFFTLFNKKALLKFADYKVWITGIVLGVVNFGSIYFLIRTLNSKILDSSIVFGINNIGIVTFSVLIGIFVFKEQTSLLNKIGIVLSIPAIILLTQA